MYNCNCVRRTNNYISKVSIYFHYIICSYCPLGNRRPYSTYFARNVNTQSFLVLCDDNCKLIIIFLDMSTLHYFMLNKLTLKSSGFALASTYTSVASMSKRTFIKRSKLATWMRMRLRKFPHFTRYFFIIHVIANLNCVNKYAYICICNIGIRIVNSVLHIQQLYNNYTRKIFAVNFLK